MRYRIVTLSDGQQICIRDLPEMTITVDVQDASVESEQEIKPADDKEYEQIAKKLATHYVKFDTMSKDMKFIKKRKQSKSK